VTGVVGKAVLFQKPLNGGAERLYVLEGDFRAFHIDVGAVFEGLHGTAEDFQFIALDVNLEKGADGGATVVGKGV